MASSVKAHSFMGFTTNNIFKYFIYLSSTLFGMIGMYYFAEHPFSVTFGKDQMVTIYHLVGPVSLSLLAPMAVATAYLFYNDVMVKLGKRSTYSEVIYYVKLNDLAPLVGLLGTVAGLMSTLMVSGTSALELIYQIGPCTISTMIGMGICIFIIMVVPLVNPEWADYYKRTNKVNNVDEAEMIKELSTCLQNQYEAFLKTDKQVADLSEKLTRLEYQLEQAGKFDRAIQL